MIAQRIDHVGLNVVDLDSSIAFYQTMFGFQVVERWDSPRQAFVGAKDVVLGLMESPAYDYHAYTMAHIAFPCEQKDFLGVVEKVQGLKLDIVAGPKAQRGGETILFRDPSGNILEVCYPSLAEWKASQTSADRQ